MWSTLLFLALFRNVRARYEYSLSSYEKISITAPLLLEPQDGAALAPRPRQAPRRVRHPPCRPADARGIWLEAQYDVRGAPQLDQLCQHEAGVQQHLGGSG